MYPNPQNYFQNPNISKSSQSYLFMLFNNKTLISSNILYPKNPVSYQKFPRVFLY